MLYRVRSSAIDWAVATAVAALAAKETSTCSSSSLKPCLPAQRVERDQDSERLAAEDERHEQ